jgi:hypothetical protein
MLNRCRRLSGSRLGKEEASGTFSEGVDHFTAMMYHRKRNQAERINALVIKNLYYKNY